MEELAEVYSISLDSEIDDRDMILLAGYFDNVGYYLDVLGLTPSEQDYARQRQKSKGTQLAMNYCLLLWKEKNPSSATMRTLLKILLSLKKEEVASKVCKQFRPKHK